MLKAPAYLWFPKDVLDSERVDALSASEECWYRRALDRSWGDGGIAADPAKAAKRIGKKCTVKAAEMILQTFFVPKRNDPSKMVNQKQNILKTKLALKIRQKVAAGKASGRKRRSNKELSPEHPFNVRSTDAEHLNLNLNLNSSSYEEDKKELSEAESSKETASPPPARSVKVDDVRKDHPAIKAVRAVAERYPPKPTWDTIIAAVGEPVDEAKLRSCLEAWLLKGYKPTNYAWACEWYRNGIPEYGGNGSRAPVDRNADCESCGNARRLRSDTGPSRPCPDCRPQEYAAWLKGKDI